MPDFKSQFINLQSLENMKDYITKFDPKIGAAFEEFIASYCATIADKYYAQLNTPTTDEELTRTEIKGTFPNG